MDILNWLWSRLLFPSSAFSQKPPLRGKSILAPQHCIPCGYMLGTLTGEYERPLGQLGDLPGPLHLLPEHTVNPKI